MPTIWYPGTYDKTMLPNDGWGSEQRDELRWWE